LRGDPRYKKLTDELGFDARDRRGDRIPAASLAEKEDEKT
jgi:hypothetical protein